MVVRRISAFRDGLAGERRTPPRSGLESGVAISGVACGGGGGSFGSAWASSSPSVGSGVGCMLCLFTNALLGRSGRSNSPMGTDSRGSGLLRRSCKVDKACDDDYSV